MPTDPIESQEQEHATSMLSMPPATNPALTSLQIDDIRYSLSELLRLSEARERTITELLAQVNTLRNGELQQAVLPLLKDLIWLFDDLEKSAVSTATRESVSGVDVSAKLRSFRDSVGDILDRYGIEFVAVEAGQGFDAKQCFAAGVAKTDRKEQDRLIARVLRPGFRQASKLIRPANVEVYRYETVEAVSVTGDVAEIKEQGSV